MSWNKYGGWGLPWADNVSSICHCEPPLADTLYLARFPTHVTGGPLTRIMGFILFCAGKRGLAEAAHTNLRVCILAAQKIPTVYPAIHFFKGQKNCNGHQRAEQKPAMTAIGAFSCSQNAQIRKHFLVKIINCVWLKIWTQSLSPSDCADDVTFYFLHDNR